MAADKAQSSQPRKRTPAKRRPRPAGAAKKRAASATRANAAPGAVGMDLDVEAFIQSLPQAVQPAMQRLRRAIRDAAPGISEGIKWNSPSFRTTD